MGVGVISRINSESVGKKDYFTFRIKTSALLKGHNSSELKQNRCLEMCRVPKKLFLRVKDVGKNISGDRKNNKQPATSIGSLEGEGAGGSQGFEIEFPGHARFEYEHSKEERGSKLLTVGQETPRPWTRSLGQELASRKPFGADRACPTSATIHTTRGSSVALRCPVLHWHSGDVEADVETSTRLETLVFKLMCEYAERDRRGQSPSTISGAL
ncbi:hypothetical protein RRG08_046421 [Elysia crispata]|uniref:Uncharacterized protein n=1 Tax=Elysia crispata TaxID=231223 RepID=A0AAE0Z9G2_9GAST|nr:hypothetical protein RRG08_046421 [Elysia crispata]